MIIKKLLYVRGSSAPSDRTVTPSLVIFDQFLSVRFPARSMIIRNSHNVPAGNPMGLHACWNIVWNAAALEELRVNFGSGEITHAEAH